MRRGFFVVGERPECRASGVGAAVREDLGIDEAPSREETRVIAELEGATAELVRAASISGFRLVLHSRGASSSIGVGRFDEAVARLLRDATPWPEDAPRDAAPLRLDPRFAFAALLQHPDPEVACAELAAVLEQHLNRAGNPSVAWMECIEALRALGHDLWSWDDRGDGSIWGHDYVTHRPGAGLELAASYPSLDAATVEVTLRPASTG